MAARGRELDFPTLVEKLQALEPYLACPRPQFQHFYDEWLKDSPHVNGPSSFLHAVVSSHERAKQSGLDDLSPAKDEQAMVLALAALDKRSDVIDCLAAAGMCGLFDAAADGKDMGKHRKKWMARAIKTIGKEKKKKGDSFAVLQAARQHATTSRTNTWVDPGKLLPIIILARKRLCTISSKDNAGKPVEGSGFLIGPSAVLTNQHVIKHLPDTLSRPERLTVRFDYSATTGLERAASSKYHPVSDWRIAQSPSGPLEPTPKAESWWTQYDSRTSWLDLVEDSLDYAVIHLDGAPGRQRGWYDLEKYGSADTGQTCWILHHPGAIYQTITQGKIDLVDYDDPPRFFHTASTENGSSGGVMLNEDGVPTGLHYMGLGVDIYDNRIEEVRIPDDVVNVAVSLKRIANDLRVKGKLDEIKQTPALVPHRGCLDGRKPVFGREDFFKELDGLAKGERPILLVGVDELESDHQIKHPGKSFSIEIVEHLFPQPENVHIVFRASELKADALKMAQLMLGQIAPDLVSTLATEPDTTTAAYVKQLVGTVQQAISDRAGNQTVWLMLDDLDVHSISDASGREFLSVLYSRVAAVTNLRIMLVGLSSGTVPSGIRTEDVETSSIRHSDYADCKELFEEWFNNRVGMDNAINDKGLLAEIVKSHAGTEAPLAQMSDFITSHMSDAVDVLFGSAQAEGNND